MYHNIYSCALLSEKEQIEKDGSLWGQICISITNL